MKGISRLLGQGTGCRSFSGRGLQVREALAAGGSNMEIARRFEVSPLTVEIHRATLMSRLGARHAVVSVRVKVDPSPEMPVVLKY